jgi:hypothetical protein
VTIGGEVISLARSPLFAPDGYPAGRERHLVGEFEG